MEREYRRASELCMTQKDMSTEENNLLVSRK
jgi:hypothetical protein